MPPASFLPAARPETAAACREWRRCHPHRRSPGWRRRCMRHFAQRPHWCMRAPTAGSGRRGHRPSPPDPCHRQIGTSDGFAWRTCRLASFLRHTPFRHPGAIRSLVPQAHAFVSENAGLRRHDGAGVRIPSPAPITGTPSEIDRVQSGDARTGRHRHAATCAAHCGRQRQEQASRSLPSVPAAAPGRAAPARHRCARRRGTRRGPVRPLPAPRSPRPTPASAGSSPHCPFRVPCASFRPPPALAYRNATASPFTGQCGQGPCQSTEPSRMPGAGATRLAGILLSSGAMDKELLTFSHSENEAETRHGAQVCGWRWQTCRSLQERFKACHSGLSEPQARPGLDKSAILPIIVRHKQSGRLFR